MTSEKALELEKRKKRKSKLKKIMTRPSGLIGSVMVILILLAAIFAPFIAPRDPLQINVMNRFEGPGREFRLGTDDIGRDLLSRIIYGSRIALSVAIPAIIFGVVIGLILGITAGYSSEKVDSSLIVFFDILRSMPALIFAIVILTMLGPSIYVLPVIMGVTRVPIYGRLIRASTLRVKYNEYVVASQALGGSKARTMFKHILPNVAAPLFIQAAMDIPVMITFEAGLSFLGLGVPPPAPSWGHILRTGYLNVRHAPHIVIYGGLALIVATLGFTLLGETLRDVFDPRLQRKGES
ncbi:ABC transporter permease [Halanaerobiaceae bacterium Z-7014]|uniref:ABC transporter permease n=1 Tax=Halonatronomonas betaini TaxID=2778430 RepID=A0A931FAF6_9FIRM|nr:ABC transporter permease [Halonatronomonas betaini]MBF8436917.1 ABC transporter permease [Halonatronomonas betaini]